MRAGFQTFSGFRILHTEDFCEDIPLSGTHNGNLFSDGKFIFLNKEGIFPFYIFHSAKVGRSGTVAVIAVYLVLFNRLTIVKAGTVFSVSTLSDFLFIKGDIRLVLLGILQAGVMLRI